MSVTAALLSSRVVFDLLLGGILLFVAHQRIAEWVGSYTQSTYDSLTGYLSVAM